MWGGESGGGERKKASSWRRRKYLEARGEGLDGVSESSLA